MPLTHDFKIPSGHGRNAIPIFGTRSCVKPSNASSTATWKGQSRPRDYVNATVGFQDLEKRTHIPAKSHAHARPEGQPVSREPHQHPHCLAGDGRRSFRTRAETVIPLSLHVAGVPTHLARKVSSKVAFIARAPQTHTDDQSAPLRPRGGSADGADIRSLYRK